MNRDILEFRGMRQPDTLGATKLINFGATAVADCVEFHQQISTNVQVFSRSLSEESMPEIPDTCCATRQEKRADNLDFFR